MSGWLRRGISWLLSVCCLLAAVSARAAAPIDFGAVKTSLDLISRIALLADPAEAWTPGQALEQAGWQPATPEQLNRGLTSSAVWLRLEVVNASDRALTRWLTLGSPRLEHVDYYRFAPGNLEPAEAGASGLAHALASRPVPGLISIFSVRLGPGESATLLLRTSGRTRLILSPAIWEPMAYRAHESEQIVQQLVPVFVLLGVALYMFVRVLAYRTGDMLLLAFWLSFMALYELSFGGHLYRFFLSAGGEAAVRSTILLSNLCLGLSAGFTLQFLGLYKSRSWLLSYGFFIVASLFLACQSVFGDMRAANSLALPLLLGFFVFWPVSIASAWYQGIRNAGLFLLATSGMWISILLRLIEQQGWISLHGLPDDGLTIRPSLVLALIMVFVVIRSSYAEQRAYREAQAALLKSRQQEHVRLEGLVRERTQTLQDAVIAADEANRARSELLARVNQDLRKPAQEIVALASPLEQADSQHAEYGGAIRRSASALVGLIDDLIDEAGAASPLGTIRLERVDIRRLLDGIAVEAEGLALSNGNEFAWHPAADMPPLILADPKRIRQVLINLLDNAAKYTSHGRVEFGVDAASDEKTATLTFTVRDTGAGMKADQLQEIFEPYRRTGGARGLPGVGLGLAITRHWVERMSGAITVASAPGRGTTMRVTLHFALADSAASVSVLSDALASGVERPEPAVLEQALHLLRLGAVSDLQDWAAELAESRPEFRVLAEQVSELAGRGDLSALALCLQSTVGGEEAELSVNAGTGHEAA